MGRVEGLALTSALLNLVQTAVLVADRGQLLTLLLLLLLLRGVNLSQARIAPSNSCEPAASSRASDPRVTKR